MIELFEARGYEVEEVGAKQLMREWSRVFHAPSWDGLEYELKEGRAIARYGSLQANPFLAMRGYRGGRLEACLCRGPLPTYETLVELHEKMNQDELYLQPESLEWTFVLSHEMDSLCPGPLFALPHGQRVPRRRR